MLFTRFSAHSEYSPVGNLKYGEVYPNSSLKKLSQVSISFAISVLDILGKIG